jgi:hypothetical protein
MRCDFREVEPGRWRCSVCGFSYRGERTAAKTCRAALNQRPRDDGRDWAQAVIEGRPPIGERRGELPGVFVIGYPGDVGGANTECWHTVKLWRRAGLDVTLIPTWQADPRWRDRLDAIGCKTIEVAPKDLGSVPGLRGATAVSFCNEHFLMHAPRFCDLGCRLVWVGCMCWLFAAERWHYSRRGPFDAYVFQSEYQVKSLAPELKLFGIPPKNGHLIRGPIDLQEIPFAPRPRVAGEPFVFGRLSRADPSKYSQKTWETYRRVVAWPKRARVLGWSDEVSKKLGPPPEWAECLPPGAEPAGQFLRSLHCLVQINGGAHENWPRSGLEAMAAGVPIVVQNQWGWREMIRHGESGFLVSDCTNEIAYWTSQLAQDEDLRLRIACQARTRVEELASPLAIASRWLSLFRSVREPARG